MNDLQDGENIEVTGSSGATYKLKNSGGIYSCTCPAWRNQHDPIERRTCKHLVAFRGKDAEEYRITQARQRAGVPTQVSPLPVPTEKEDGKLKIWKPMLAQTWEGSVDPTGWLMSEKLDGVRAYWDGTQFWSRQSNKFYAPEWFLERLPPFPLDGELFGGRKKFQTTVSIVRRQDASDQWKDIRYRVFDVLEDGTAFELRMQKAQVWFGEHHPPFAEIHEQVPCTGLHHLQAELARILQLGGEGVMIRKPGSAYEHARTSSLLKVKRMQDAEAKVTGYTQGTGKYADGMAGALEVEMPNGKKFKIGTCLSDQDRLNPPPIGSVVTYQYQELSNDGIPRFPAFLRVRGDITWVDIKDNHIPTAPEKMGTRISMKRKELPERSTQGTSSVTSTAKKEYYEYIDATKHSAKFWELNLDGTVVAVRYGRIGTAGHVGNPKKFTTEQEAAKFAEKMRNAKLKEGYILNQHK